MVIGHLDIHIPKNTALDADPTHIANINSKWITDPNGKHKIVQFGEHNMGESPDDVGYRGDFLDITPKT